MTFMNSQQDPDSFSPEDAGASLGEEKVGAGKKRLSADQKLAVLQAELERRRNTYLQLNLPQVGR